MIGRSLNFSLPIDFTRMFHWLQNYLSSHTWIQRKLVSLGKQKVSSFWSQVSLKISAVTRFFFQKKFPIHKVWWLREASQIGQTFIPLCEKVVGNAEWLISNQSSNFGCNWTSFYRPPKKKKTKNEKCRCAALRRRTRRHFWVIIIPIKCCVCGVLGRLNPPMVSNRVCVLLTKVTNGDGRV